ncbi:hypothetical protein [uncultured Treponema sp.]|uniref:hypothetical protein n=1 Tax=uncultured Treponema sp. TaxID=162155 RepID=UPI002586DF64|nr:hypothetical protein [uncultured Treponema sp.]
MSRGVSDKITYKPYNQGEQWLLPPSLDEMEIIKIKFDYMCFPVWIYNENNELKTNDLPDYLIGDKIIDTMFVELQNIYNSLFIDDMEKFEFKGFLSDEDKNNFLNRVSYAVNLLTQKVNKSTIIEFDKESLIKLIN